MAYQSLALKKDSSVWTLTIQRPEALNALNSQVLEDLNSALNELEQKEFSDCQVLIITGAGEKAFVAGADIKEINLLDAPQAKKFAERGQRIFRRFEKLKIPVIAAVNGFALGGGLELALSCDFIYAADNAKLGLPEVSLGLIPGFGGTVRLPRWVGPARAKEIIYSGNMLTAQEAADCGLVNKVLPLTELMPAVIKMAQTIASRAPIAVSSAKKSIQNSFDQEIDVALNVEAEKFANLFHSKDTQEGTMAFIEKRKAQFKGH